MRPIRTFKSFQLRKQGFLNVDALEPSDGMIRKAKEKGVYSNFICDKITDNQLDIKEGEGKMSNSRFEVITLNANFIRIVKLSLIQEATML